MQGGEAQGHPMRLRPRRVISFRWNRKMKVIEQKEIYDMAKQQPRRQTRPSYNRRPRRSQDNTISPPAQISQDYIPSKKFTDMPLENIKRTSKSSWPKSKAYELTQQDRRFMQTTAKKYKNQGLPFLSQRLMKAAIIFLEQEVGKRNDQFNKINWLSYLLRNKKSNLSNAKHIKSIQLDIWKYWRRRCSDQGFPLYRLMWKSLKREDPEFNFMPRIRKRNQRKIDIENIIKEEQLERAALISHQDKAHQTVELKKSYIEEVQHQQTFLWLDKIGKVEDLRQSFKLQNEIAQNNMQGSQKDINENNLKQVQKQKQDRYVSIVCYLATIISEIEESGIQFGHIFPEAFDSTRQTFISRESFQQRLKEECPFEKKSKSSVKSKSLQPKRSKKSPQMPKEWIDCD